MRRSGSSITANSSAATEIAAPQIDAPELPNANTAALADVQTEAFARTAQASTVVAVPAPVIQVPINNVGLRRNAFIASGVAPIARTSVTNYVDTQYRVLERDLAGTGATIKRRGEQIVIDSNATVSGRAANRRVELILTPYAG